ncbi:hypothetical protein B0H14DRAFT_3015150, partial [Mycena olivaceomarginata]
IAPAPSGSTRLSFSPIRLVCATVFVDADILTSRMRLRALVPARNAIALRPPHPHLCLAPPMATPTSPLRARPPASVPRPTRPLPRRSAAPSPKPGRPPLPIRRQTLFIQIDVKQGRHHQIRGRWLLDEAVRYFLDVRRRSSLWACGCWGRAWKTRS